jgi:hypothetical protein
MKQKLLAGLSALVLALGPAALAQPSTVWEWWGQMVVPSTDYPYAPQIDAITFINHAGGRISISGTSLFNTSDTLNFTNQGSMTGFPGFDFQTYPPGNGQPRMAANIANLVSGPNNGFISCNGTFFYGGIGGLFFGNLAGNAKIILRATNIVNSGTIDMTASSLLKMNGKNINLARGNLNMANTQSTTLFGTNTVFNGVNLLFNAGILDGYWAAETATNGFNPVQDFTGQFPFTPFHWVTNRNYFMLGEFLPNSFVGTVPYVFDSGAVNSNRFVQAVFLNNTDPAFINSVYFTPAQIAVQWQWTTPAWPGTTITTNYLYLTDNFGEVTNIGIAVDGYINPQALYPTPTYRPVNYQFVQGVPYTFNNNVPAATPGLLPNLFIDVLVTNQYTGYQGLFTAGTALPTDIAGGAYSNMPGRIEISAEASLDLDRTRISTLNYLLLEATNHFKGSQNAVITAPYADYNLRATNGLLTISNIIAPFVAHPKGTCSLYSARWTNVVNNITNSYHVLFVDSVLLPLTTPEIGSLRLAVTNSPATAPRNLVINDVLNITTGMQLNAERITVAQNDPSAFATAGELNLLTGGIVWPTSTPNLQYLTNWGTIGMQNAVYFGGSRTQPPYNTNLVDIPYQAMVNHGGITNQGTLIWANYFENTGTIEAGLGSFVLQKCTNAQLNGGLVDASSGQVSIAVGTLVASNHMILSGGALDLYLTNLVSDGGPTLFGFGGNQWLAQNGFSLYRKATLGDLLGTTVYNYAVDYAETLNYWAGLDRGRSNSGFTNNCAIGKLILNGGVGSDFRFIGTGVTNGLYVDYLELDGSATNRDLLGNFTGLNIDPNIKIYFAEAVANGRSIAEKLDGKNGGRLVWVSTYAGAYSSTNLLYPDGRIYTFNRALVQSCNLDSDNDGIANCSDSTPIFVPGIVSMSISLTNRPPTAKVLSWQSIAGATNYLYYRTNSNLGNWLLLTNFVSGPNNGNVSALDPSSNSTRYYRVRVEPRQP